MTLCIRATAFYNFNIIFWNCTEGKVWYYGMVPTGWYFGIVPKAWYFGIVPKVWYYGIVPIVWYL
jgi:hypothetical protein